MKTHVLIQARSSSSRLPFKSLLKINSFFIVQLLYKRVFSKKYKTTILTSLDKTDDYLYYLLKKNKLNCYRGDLSNVKKRFLSFTKNFKNEDIIVRLTADNIFIDKNLVKFLVQQLINKKKNYLFINNKFSNLPYGISLEAFKYSYFKNNKNFSKLDKEHVTYSFDKSKQNSIKLNNEKKIWKKLNLSIDYLENYQFIKKIFKKIKNPTTIRWFKLCTFFEKSPVKNIYTKDLKVLSLRSKELTNKKILEICTLKMQEWKFPLKEQLRYFKFHYNKNDINNLIYIKKKLVGYTMLKKKKYKGVLVNLIDTVIIDKNYRKKNLGSILMNLNNSEICKYKLPSYLLCKSKELSFYNKFYWKKLNDKKIPYFNENKKLKLMCLKFI